jgi:ferredoxin-fold anticodon binding domain-containing protein
MKGDDRKKQRISDRKWFSNCMGKNIGDKNIFSSHMVRIGVLRSVLVTKKLESR